MAPLGFALLELRPQVLRLSGHVECGDEMEKKLLLRQMSGLHIENSGTHLRIRARLQSEPVTNSEILDLDVLVEPGADQSLRQLTVATLDRAAELIALARADIDLGST